MTGGGPYLNEDGDYWYPRGEWTWNRAQHDAAGEALWTVGDWAKARYEGIDNPRVSDEREEPHPEDCEPGGDPEAIDDLGLCDGCCRTVSAYHFRVVEP